MSKRPERLIRPVRCAGLGPGHPDFDRELDAHSTKVEGHRFTYQSNTPDPHGTYEDWRRHDYEGQP